MPRKAYYEKHKEELSQKKRELYQRQKEQEKMHTAKQYLETGEGVYKCIMPQCSHLSPYNWRDFQYHCRERHQMTNDQIDEFVEKNKKQILLEHLSHGALKRELRSAEIID
jgi:hypothetical protein